MYRVIAERYDGKQITILENIPNRFVANLLKTDSRLAFERENGKGWYTRFFVERQGEYVKADC